MSISGSSVVGYAFAGNHSWPPSWVGAQFQTDVISGSITPEGASRQNLSLRTGANWQQVVPVPGIIALVVPQSREGFFMRDQREKILHGVAESGKNES